MSRLVSYSLFSIGKEKGKNGEMVMCCINISYEIIHLHVLGYSIDNSNVWPCYTLIGALALAMMKVMNGVLTHHQQLPVVRETFLNTTSKMICVQLQL